MSLIQGGSHKVNTTAFYPKTIDQSLRFEDGDSAYLSRTPASAGNRKTFTWSGWVKRGNLGTNTTFFSTAASDTSNPRSQWRFTSDTLYLGFNPAGGAWYEIITTPVYRDPSAWYHIVVAVDTTQSTSSDRVKLYVNGEQVTAFGTSNYPPQNTDLTFNNTVQHTIGRYEAGDSEYLDGYLAEVHFTDGTAYDADAFGELKSGIWVAKSPSVTYGTNGFHLDGSDITLSGSDITFVNDTSTNSNNFTANNLVASDVVLDSPTNNFCTMNPLKNSTTLKEGNLQNNFASNLFRGSTSTFAIDSGKWYWEQTLGGIPGLYCNPEGPKSGDALTYPGDDSATNRGIGLRLNLNYLYVNNTSIRPFSSTLSTFAGFALDADNDTLEIYDDTGTLFYTVDLSDPHGDANSAKDMTQHKPYFIGGGTVNGGSQIYNFGQDSTFAGNETAGGNSDDNGIGDFQNAPPSGYLALCTANLPDPAIDPAQDATPEDHFNVALYTGASALTVDTGLPSVDMVWIKARGAAYLPRIIDSIRGDNTALYTAAAVAEGSYSVNDDCELNTPTNGNLYFDVTNAGTNGSGVSTVAWAWKAGGTAVANTDGSITSTVSANTDAGFSIVSYVGNGTAGATIGHGLNSAPEMIIGKSRDSSTSWQVYHEATGATKLLTLNLTDAAATNSTAWNNTEPTSTVFTLGTGTRMNASGDNNIAYCFHSVDGFSKVGSYTGNGSTDGAFVYTGFRPKWIMVKRSDSGVATSDWYIWDAERNTFNVAGKTVQANESTAESDSGNHDLDILSNGFKLRIDYATVNGSGNTHIYLCFAEQPFKYSNGR